MVLLCCLLLFCFLVCVFSLGDGWGVVCQNSPFLYEFFDINESTESGIGETVHR